jgi:hypothetical protein
MPIATPTMMVMILARWCGRQSKGSNFSSNPRKYATSVLTAFSSTW